MYLWDPNFCIVLKTNVTYALNFEHCRCEKELLHMSSRICISVCMQSNYIFQGLKIQETQMNLPSFPSTDLQPIQVAIFFANFAKPPIEDVTTVLTLV